MKFDIEAAILILIALVLIVLGVVIDRHGYNRGVSARDAYYQPILLKAAQDKAAADQKAQAADQRAQQINTDLEDEHAKDHQALVVRVADAESRIADLLHERAANTPHCSSPVPAIPPAPAARTGPAPGDERDNRLAASVSTVGGKCEHDADGLAEWQEWYSRQRKTLTQ